MLTASPIVASGGATFRYIPLNSARDAGDAIGSGAGADSDAGVGVGVGVGGGVGTGAGIKAGEHEPSSHNASITPSKIEGLCSLISVAIPLELIISVP